MSKKISNQDCAKWIYENTGLLEGWAKWFILPDWFSADDVKLIVEAAIRAERRGYHDESA